MTVCALSMRFFLCKNKEAKYVERVRFAFPFFNRGQIKTTQPINKIFSQNVNWNTNYQTTI